MTIKNPFSSILLEADCFLSEELDYFAAFINLGGSSHSQITYPRSLLCCQSLPKQEMATLALHKKNSAHVALYVESISKVNLGPPFCPLALQ